jgi:hypothetical protein
MNLFIGIDVSSRQIEVVMLTSEKTVLFNLENLYYKVNKLATGTLENSSVFSVTMFDLITGELTIDELAQMPLKDLAELLNKKGNGKFSQPEKLAQTLQKAIHGSYRLDKVLADSVNIVLSIYANEIRNYQGLIKQLDKSIEKVVTILPESQILESIPESDKFTPQVSSLKSAK